MTERRSKDVLVLGAGITGSAVAVQLGRAGCGVYLVERQPQIGGNVVQMGCKATDICLRCNVCVADEIFRDVFRTAGIKVYTTTSLVGLEQDSASGRYRAVLRSEARFVDSSRCIFCRACVDVCPVHCITLPSPASARVTPIIDYSLCLNNRSERCSICADRCPVGAICLQAESTELVVEIDNIVIATGHDIYDASCDAALGYKSGTNIISGFDAERQLLEHNRLIRPSDGRVPKKIAFIQCVGSRSDQPDSGPQQTNYCSAVCCAYALRIARLAKYVERDCEVTIFYMDIQNFGKGFNQFYEFCRENMTFVRCRPYQISPNPDGTVTVTYTDGTELIDEKTQLRRQDFDMVVLSVGIRPRADAVVMSDMLGIAVDENGFFGLKSALAISDTQRQGIYAAGTCEGPKDIESCIRQAEAISAAILSG